MTRLNLSELVEQVCAEQPYPRERLLAEAEPGIFVQGDGALLTRLLQNLIDNGFKYGQAGGPCVGGAAPGRGGGAPAGAGRRHRH